MTFEHWCHDLRLAGRSLSHAKAFTAAAVLTMALGITGTTVMFALIQGVLLRPMPVREQERLVVGWKEFPGGRFAHWPFQVDEIDTIGRESRLLERVGGIGYTGAYPEPMVEGGEASEVGTSYVTGTFFATLGVLPALGRALEPADDRAGAEGALVIAHGLWQRRYGGSPDVLGRRLTLRGQPFTVVGVMPRDFEYPRGVEAWMTVEAMASTMAGSTFRETLRREIDLVARLRPGATRPQVLEELKALVPRLEADPKLEMPRGLAPVVRSYEDVVVGEVRPALVVLFAAVGFVLLIASANVANLLLLRSEERRSELAVRAALGASRGRIASPLLAESALLALAAGLVGLAAGGGVLRGVLAFVPGGLPRVEAVRIDGAVVLFTVAVAFVAAALAGVAPALYAGRADLAGQLRTGRMFQAAGARRGRRTLIAAQVALSVTVLAVAGLLTRSLLRLQRVDMGLVPGSLFLVSLTPPPAEGDGRERRHFQFLDEVVARLVSVPGIENATPLTTPPFAGTSGWDAPSWIAEGQTREQAAANPSLNLEAVYPNHFATLQVQVLGGRAFTAGDRPGTPEVAIVSEDVAARVWPGQDPIGRRLKLGITDERQPWRTIVGVARTTRYRELAVPRPTAYLSASQFGVPANALLVRGTRPAAALWETVRGHVRAVDPSIQVMSVLPFRQLLAAPLARPRFNTLLIGIFGASSLLLAVVGLYAVLSAGVRQRHPEIGIRLALGAGPAQVRRLVLGEGLRLSAIGAAIGLGLAVAGTRALRGLLFGVDPLDPVSLLGAALLLLVASALACELPARRATAVDPGTVLRGG